MRTFYFNTGVKVHNNPTGPIGGTLSTNGVWIIPFDCDDVPDNATFVYACDSSTPLTKNTIVRKIHNSGLLSKYAHFAIN